MIDRCQSCITVIGNYQSYITMIDSYQSCITVIDIYQSYITMIDIYQSCITVTKNSDRSQVNTCNQRIDSDFKT